MLYADTPSPRLPRLVAAALALLELCVPCQAKTSASRAVPGVRIDDRGRPAERARLEAALAHLQGSPTARRLERRRRRLGPVTVAFAVLGSSSAASPDGPWGRALTDREPPLILLDEGLAVSTHAFAETLAHELYGHGANRPARGPTSAC